jgi:rod shape-determining protein MreD
MRVFLLSLLACAAAQTVLLDSLSVGGARPDCFLLLVLCWSPRVRPELATIQGFCVGLCQDALSGGPLGLKAFTYSLLGFLTALLSHDLVTDKPLAQFWLLLAGAAGAGALSFLLLSFFTGLTPLLPALRVIVPETLYTAVAGFLLLRLPWVRIALARTT